MSYFRCLFALFPVGLHRLGVLLRVGAAFMTDFSVSYIASGTLSGNPVIVSD